MSLIKQQLYNIMNSREQLMEDIEAIVDTFDRDFETDVDLVYRLCDAVCYNFPTTEYSISELEETAIDSMGIGK
jgi:CO dehydrogenase nickel-insertion accessory protein CooC1